MALVVWRMPKWSSPPTLPSCVRWSTARILPVVAAWCGGKLVVARPESPSNKLVPLPRLRAGRRGGGVRRFLLDLVSEADSPLLGSLRAPVTASNGCAGSTSCAGRGVPPADVLSSTPRPRCVWRAADAAILTGPLFLTGLRRWNSGRSSPSRAPLVVRRRGPRRRRSLSSGSSLSCVCIFLFTQGCFCNRGLDNSSVLQMFFV